MPNSAFFLDQYGNAINQPGSQSGNATSTTSSQLNALNTAIPGFSGLTAQAAQRIRDLQAGKLPADVNTAIQDARATQAVASGMPGSSNTQGTLQGNATLRDIGQTSFSAGQQGFDDLLSMLGAYSGTVTPNVSQTQGNDQFNATLAQRLREFQANQDLERRRLDQQQSQFNFLHKFSPEEQPPYNMFADTFVGGPRSQTLMGTYY